MYTVNQYLLKYAQSLDVGISVTATGGGFDYVTLNLPDNRAAIIAFDDEGAILDEDEPTGWEGEGAEVLVFDLDSMGQWPEETDLKRVFRGTAKACIDYLASLEHAPHPDRLYRVFWGLSYGTCDYDHLQSATLGLANFSSRDGWPDDTVETLSKLEVAEAQTIKEMADIVSVIRLK